MTLQQAFEQAGKGIIACADSGEHLLTHKIDKHISLDNPEKVATYLTLMFTSARETPEGFEDQFVGCIKPVNKEVVNRVPGAVRAIEYLKSKGWKIKLGHIPGYESRQILVYTPDDKYYYYSEYIGE